MASIKDSVEESFQDDLSFIKVLIFSTPLFVIVNFSKEQIPGYSFLLVIIVLLLLGFVIRCTYNVRRGKNEILPSFNILGTFWDGLKSVVALAPAGLIVYFLSKFLVNILVTYIPNEQFVNIFSYAIYAILSSFIFASYLLYADNLKITDAYNIKSISTYCIDILVGIIFMLIQLAIVDAILLVPVTYVLWLFFGIPHPVAIFFWSVLFVYNMAFIGHYMGQISYEIIEVKERNKH